MWIDSNIQIVDKKFEDLITNLIDNGSIMAQIDHPMLNCIYDNAKQCIIRRKDDMKSIMKIVKLLKTENNPYDNVITETNIIRK